MRVVRIRACVKRTLLYACGLVLSILALLLWTPEPPAPRSPRRHLPADYWVHRTYYPHKYKRSGCVSPPGFREVQYGGVVFWQRVTSEREPPVLVFAAYWDARAEPLVRALVHAEERQTELICLLWYYDIGDPMAVAASAPALDAHAPAALQVVSCAPPSSPPPHTLAAVSVVTTDFTCGTPRNILAVQGVPKSSSEKSERPLDPRERGARAGACLLWWRGGDAAARLAEWLQLLRHAGVHTVYLYINHNAHENVLRVVDYFSYDTEPDATSMAVDVMPYASPPVAARDHTTTPAGNRSSHRNSQARAQDADFEEYSDDYKEVTVTNSKEKEEIPAIRRDDLLPYNECVYRALGEQLTWLALLDIDEVIVPLRDGTWERLTYKESLAAKFLTDELPDVMHFQRWWYPEMLQPNLTTPAPVTHRVVTSYSGEYVAGIKALSSAAPPAVPPGRIFAYEWRAPTPRDDVVVTGKLLRTASVVSVRRRDVTCVRDCRPRVVDGEVASVHVYTSRCGGASRGVCRALRRVAARSDVMWRWRRAQQDAAIVLARARLTKHARSDRDDE